MHVKAAYLQSNLKQQDQHVYAGLYSLFKKDEKGCDKGLFKDKC